MTSTLRQPDGDPRGAGSLTAGPPENSESPESPESPEQAQRRVEVARWLARRRLERTLHDGASLRISALALRIGLLRHQESTDREHWRTGVGEIQDELHAVLQELRELSASIYPPLLDQAGLGPALHELADQNGLDLRIDADGTRFGPVAEGAAYYGIAQWLANRREDAPVALVLRREDNELVLSVQPMDAAQLGHLLDHARPLGGVVYPTTPQAGDQRAGMITMRIPCE
jgi:hypothetical protein